MVDTPGELDFPILGLLPKRETGILTFLSKYPEYDGRGTIIAILDSGVDPGAPGLQKTSDGKVKVLERFDCSGCGDVNTTTIVKPNDDGYITGLSGRKLKIPSTWNNPTNNYRIGIKHAYSLYPERLKERISAEYKEKKWDNFHRKAVAEVNRELGDFDSQHPGSNLSDSDKLIKEDIDAKVEILSQVEKKFTDSGPAYDCVLFHDGEKWMCCVDTSECGDLENSPLLGEYSITHQYTPLTKSDSLNFSVNVHDNGDTLELVGLCSSHGTHVASIASAYFPDRAEKNGSAPGAQIFSFTIGDGRLGSMETGTALVRAIIKIMEFCEKGQKIHVINMSYGELSHFSDMGRVGELMNEVVNKYGVVWVCSAGNDGPALSTVSTPPDISQETMIGVGAYVSPEMMIAAYSMRQKLPGMPFTWTSRGPCTDGALGITVCAPGGAITSVPNFTLKNSQLFNGTSMAAPHVAGAVAILISGLLQENLSYSPYSMQRAIKNTAQLLDGVEIFAQGSGLLQVDKCYEFLVNYHNAIETNVRFHISCGSSNSKGIYIRSAIRNNGCNAFNVTVEPHFLNTDNVPPETKIKFNMKFALVCQADYVNGPTHLDMSNCSRVFAVKIDPSRLEPGAHITFIEAYDVTCVKKGPIFKIPITVIQTEDVKPKYYNLYQNIAFKPNTIKRHFYVVPNYATWAVIRLIAKEPEQVGRFVLHALHILPRQSCKTLEINKAITITSNTETVVSFQVRSNIVLEVAIAKYWANLGDISLDYSISFYGTKPNQQRVTMHAAEGVYSVQVTTLQGEEVLPIITLKNSVQVLKPSEAKVLTLTERDIIPPNRQIYQLLLVYNFSLTKSTDVSPNVSLLSDVLYESEFESQLWLLYDTNKQLLGCGDAYPSKYSIKLEKGDYVIRLNVRHEKKEYLDKLTELPILLQQKLPSPINMDLYNNYSQAVIGGKKASVVYGLDSMIVPLYIAPLSNEKFNSKSNNPAHFLTGSITYCKDDLGKKVDNYSFKYILHDITVKKTNTVNSNSSNSNNISNNNLNNNTLSNGSNGNNGNNGNENKSKVDEIKEAVRDLKTQMLSKLDIQTADKLYEEFLNEYPEHYPIHTAYLQVLDPLDSKRSFPVLSKDEDVSYTMETQMKILYVCQLLAYHSVKNDLRSDTPKLKSLYDQQKAAYVECLCRKGIALCRIYFIDDDNTDELLDSINSCWKSLQRFIEINDPKLMNNFIIYFTMWHAAVYKHYGRILKYALKLQDEKPVKELEEKIINLCKLNGWDYMGQHFSRNLPSKFPSAYRPF